MALPDGRSALRWHRGRGGVAAALLAEVGGVPRPRLPAWAGGPLGDTSPAGVEAHLLRLVEHLAQRSAASWCAEHGDDADAVRSALLGLVDPALGPAAGTLGR